MEEPAFNLFRALLESVSDEKQARTFRDKGIITAIVLPGHDLPE